MPTTRACARECPVAHSDAWGGFWALMKHADVVARRHRQRRLHHLEAERGAQGGLHGPPAAAAPGPARAHALPARAGAAADAAARGALRAGDPRHLRGAAVGDGGEGRRRHLRGILRAHAHPRVQRLDEPAGGAGRRARRRRPALQHRGAVQRRCEPTQGNQPAALRDGARRASPTARRNPLAASIRMPPARCWPRASMASRCPTR